MSRARFGDSPGGHGDHVKCPAGESTKIARLEPSFQPPVSSRSRGILKRLDGKCDERLSSRYVYDYIDSRGGKTIENDDLRKFQIPERN